jgi:putative regulator of septum formation
MTMPPWTPPGEPAAEPGDPPPTPSSGLPPYQPPPAYPYGFQPRQPPYPGGPHPDGIPPSKTMAGWALGLCIFGCSAVTWIVGVVLAIVVLVESRREGRDRGKGLAIAALVVAGCWTLVLVAGIAVSASSSDREGEPDLGTILDPEPTSDPAVTPSKLRVGDCFDDPALVGLGPGDDSVQANSVTMVPCERPHDLEAYEVVGLEGDSYPGLKAVRRAADEGCGTAFKPYVGISYGRSDLDFWVYYPTERSWTLLADHAVTCVVGDPDAKTRGTLKGSRK